MNGNDVLNNLMDELDRAKELIQEYKGFLEKNEISVDSIDELLGDIEADRGRFYDFADSFYALCEDIEIEPEVEQDEIAMD